MEKAIVQEVYEISAEYEEKRDPKKLEEFGNMITSLDAGDSIVVAMSFSHMLNLANLAEEVQISRRRRKKVKKGHFADENNATTDEIKRTPLRPQDELRPGMSYFHETIWNGVSRFHQAICLARKVHVRI
ncbi:hypothetical protein VIGAN_08127000 [Vigna angularis var. angularis]|uniref:Uncharacterized protein n=1 Tax=Vigna angularis var. angularis TaxID=157739 RepID=A0A0S3SPB1_PHAAN|nr:hypothetical protein VIGAN_08127000 [Vigna angularis var. angularis]